LATLDDVARSRTFFLIAALGLFALLLAACGGEEPAPAPPAGPPQTTTGATETEPPATETEPPVTETEPPAETLTLSVYFLRGEKIGVAHRQVPQTQEVARAAMEELLAGPTPEEEAAGLHSEIPEGTELLDIALADGVATVDLSGPYDDGGGSLTMFARLAQVVFTLTQFPTVEGVVFRLDGEPVEVFSSEGIVLEGPQTREGYEDVTPQILVESPAVGDTVTSPVRFSGLANVFEATVTYELVDADGNVLAGSFVTATCGTGCWGTFDVEVPFDAGGATGGTFSAFEVSAKDGSRIHVVDIPVAFG
jgi:hypothetical protein